MSDEPITILPPVVVASGPADGKPPPLDLRLPPGSALPLNPAAAGAARDAGKSLVFTKPEQRSSDGVILPSGPHPKQYFLDVAPAKSMGPGGWCMSSGEIGSQQEAHICIRKGIRVRIMY